MRFPECWDGCAQKWRKIFVRRYFLFCLASFFFAHSLPWPTQFSLPFLMTICFLPPQKIMQWLSTDVLLMCPWDSEVPHPSFRTITWRGKRSIHSDACILSGRELDFPPVSLRYVVYFNNKYIVKWIKMLLILYDIPPNLTPPTSIQ